jgi:hypothetical protein
VSFFFFFSYIGLGSGLRLRVVADELYGLPYCVHCQENSYLSMSSYPSQESQESQHPLMLQSTRRLAVPGNVVEQRQSRVSTVEAPRSDATNGNIPCIRIEEPESKEEV